MTEAFYYVPRSQVWSGSRGRQAGRVHLHVDGRALCGRRRGWYERPPLPSEERCERCARAAEKRGIPWPGDVIAPCEDPRCPCETGQPCSFGDAIDRDPIAQHFYAPEDERR